MSINLSNFAKALQQGATITFNLGLFQAEFATQYGRGSVELSLNTVREKLPTIAKWAFPSSDELEGIRAYLNGLIEDAEEAENRVAGAVVLVRRTRQEWHPGWLGTGAGRVSVHEAFVEYTEDYADPWGEVCVKKGNREWVRTEPPVIYERL